MTGTPIFKIHKIQHFVTICENTLFELSNIHEQNHFITKAYDWRKGFMQKLEQVPGGARTAPAGTIS